jgi:hypothetical protein
MAGLLSSPSNLAVPLSVFADNPLRLTPEDYPNIAWSEQTAHYDQMWSYYKGYVLNKKKNGVELYPVKLNIVRSTVINHAAVLLGQFSDDNSIIQFGVRNNPAIDKDTANKVTKASNMLWSINNGDETLLEQSLFQQVFGGCYWHVAWTPLRKKWPIRYFSIDPRACFPVWDGNDYNRLVSMDVYHQIPKPTAVARYRIDLFGNSGITAEVPGQPDYVSVHEHWDESEYFIKIDQQIGRWPDGTEMAGENPFLDPVLGHKVIPYIYIPRLRAGDFYGDSLVPGLIGPQNEINNGLADLGEGLADAMHQQPWVRNRMKGIQGLDKKSRSEFIDLGMNQHGQDTPEVGRLEGAELTDPMIDLVTEEMIRMTREHSNMPDVAFGRTDASIRSALTLKYMMWPATNVGIRYRKSFSTGLKYLNYIAFVIAYSKRQLGSNINGVASLGIDAVNPEMIETVLVGQKTHWPPMLPDDRADLVNEIVQRISVELISPETAIRRLDGSDELEEELNRIDKHRQKLAEEATKRMEEQAPLNERTIAVKEEEKAKNKPPSDRTNRAQAAGGRAKGEDQ